MQRICLHFGAIAGLVNRPKDIRIHLTISRVRVHLLRFNSSGDFCDGGAICSRELPARIRITNFGGYGFYRDKDVRAKRYLMEGAASMSRRA
jgi:hypothetical protein